MPLSFSNRRVLVRFLHIMKDVRHKIGEGIKDTVFSLMNHWGALAYALVLLFIGVNEGVYNNFVSEHVGTIMNGIRESLDANMLVNIAFLLALIVAEIWLLMRLIQQKSNLVELVTYCFLLYEVTNNKGWYYANLPFGLLTYKGLLGMAFLLNGILSLVVVIKSHNEKVQEKRSNKAACLLLKNNKLPGFATPALHAHVKRSGWEEFIDSLVKRINGTDLSEEAFAIGVVGEWGAGKTTFLNQLETQMRPMYRVVKFNPWNSLSPSQLIDDFFSMLSDAVKDDESIVKAIRSYMGVLNDIDLIPKWGSVLTRYVFKDSQPQNISSVKDAVQRALVHYPQRVAVLIDDLDRLEEEELFEVLRIVRITANFRNIVFIVTYDREHVDRMLKKKNITDFNYLKKIFPLEIALPANEKFTLPRMLENDLAGMLQNESMMQSLRPYIYYRNLYGQYFLMKYLNNFRDVKRFASAFALNACHVMTLHDANSFTLYELFWLELLRYSDYPLYETLRTDCYKYLRQSSDDKGGIKIQLKNEKERPVEISENSWFIMTQLFAAKRNDLKASSIVYINNYDNYFSYRVLDDTISVDEARSLYDLSRDAVYDKVNEICDSGVEKKEALRQYLLRTNPKKLQTLEQRKTFLSLLVAYAPKGVYSQINQDLRNKLNKHIFPNSEYEELRKHLISIIDDSITHGVMKETWWLHCLTELVDYWDENPDDENPFSNEYCSLLKEEDIKALACKSFKKVMDDYIVKPAITDITDKNKRFYYLVNKGVAAQGYSLYDYEHSYMRYKSLVIDVLLDIYKEEKSTEWKKFVSPLIDEELYNCDEQEVYDHYHNMVRKLFGDIDNYRQFVQTCFIDEDGKLEEHLKQFGILKDKK